MFPVPYGTGLEIAAWAAIAVAVASAAYSIYMMSTMDKGGGYSSTNGLGLDLNPAKANTAKLGDAIRELFGAIAFTLITWCSRLHGLTQMTRLA